MLSKIIEAFRTQNVKCVALNTATSKDSRWLTNMMTGKRGKNVTGPFVRAFEQIQ